MSRLARLSWVASLALVLSACDVSLHDETPAEYTVNHGLGMYEIKASVAREAMVSSDSVFVTAIVDHQELHLEADGAEGEYRALFPIKCRSSFPLQYRAVWTVQGITTRTKVFPDQPRTIRLNEPQMPRDTIPFDTSAKNPKGWDGTVHYQFVTVPNTQIVAARIEPLTQDAADVKAAAPISVSSGIPLSVDCGTPGDVSLHSKANHARGYLVIETNNPEVKEWRTKVQFGS